MLSAQSIGKAWPQKPGDLKFNLQNNDQIKNEKTKKYQNNDQIKNEKTKKYLLLLLVNYGLIFFLYLKRKIIFSSNEPKVNLACV